MIAGPSLFFIVYNEFGSELKNLSHTSSFFNIYIIISILGYSNISMAEPGRDLLDTSSTRELHRHMKNTQRLTPQLLMKGINVYWIIP